MSLAFWLLASLLLLEKVGFLLAHGRLLDPACRSTMWRIGFNAPINYNDNGLNCGGYSALWYRNKGKCGVCGDPYDGRRDNEAGGKYATGQIVAQFGPEEVITSTVQLTVNHGGYFEFDLCPVNQPNVKATENCFARYPLSLPDGRRMFILPDRNAGYFHVPLRLPPGLTCRQCVFRWKYVTATSWGCDKSRCCKGCGPQEEFFGCADISIEPKAFTKPTTPTATTWSLIPGLNRRTTHKVPNRPKCQAKLPWRNSPSATPWCLNHRRHRNIYNQKYCEESCFLNSPWQIASVFSPRFEHSFWDGIIKASNETIQTVDKEYL